MKAFRLPNDPALLPGVLVVLASLAVYVSTLPRTVFGLDSAELATGAYTLGIVHSPGAPLYMLLGHLMCRVPWGEVGFRLNLMSALFAAAAAGLHYLVGLRVVRQPWLAAAAALAVAFNYYIWAWAIVAELYAPHTFFVLLVTWLLLKGLEQGRLSWFVGAGMAGGLGLGNHTALSLMAPAYAWLILSAPAPVPRRIKALLVAGMGAAVGLLVYLYFPLRQAASPALDYVRDYFPEIDLATPAGLWWMFRGGMFESLFFQLPLSAWGAAAGQHLLQLAGSFTVPGCLAVLIGLGLTLRRPDRLAIGLLLMWILHVGFFSSYGALDRAWMYSVSYLVAGWWLARGLGWGWTRLAHVPAARRYGFTLAGAAVLSLLVLHGFRVLDLRHDVSARRYYEWAFRVLPPQSVFFGWWEQIPILEYGQRVEGKRPDLQLANMVFLGDDDIRQRMERARAAGRPVYASRPLTAWPGATWTPLGPDRWPLYRWDP